MPLQAYQNDDPLFIVWHDREVGPERLAGCNGLIIQALFPGAPRANVSYGFGAGCFSGLVNERKGKCKGNVPAEPIL